MFNLRNTPLSKILVALVLFAMVFNPVSPVAAQSSTPTISNYSELPQRGQLVIPVGSQFVVPQEWNGLVVTIWRGMGDATVNPVIDFSNSIAKDRSDRYGGKASDFQTVVWDKMVHPLPGFNGRQACDDAFGHDAATLVAGTSIGDAGCFEMIEFDQTSHPVQIAVPTLVPTSTSLPIATATPSPTISVEASVTPSTPAMQQTATVDPLVIPINGSVNKLNLMGFAILVLLAAVLFLAFRRPSAAPVAPVAPKAAAPRRKKTAPKKKSAEK